MAKKEQSLAKADPRFLKRLVTTFVISGIFCFVAVFFLAMWDKGGQVQLTGAGLSCFAMALWAVMYNGDLRGTPSWFTRGVSE